MSSSASPPSGPPVLSLHLDDTTLKDEPAAAKSPLSPSSTSINFAKLAMKRNYSGEFSSGPGNAMPATVPNCNGGQIGSGLTSPGEASHQSTSLSSASLSHANSPPMSIASFDSAPADFLVSRAPTTMSSLASSAGFAPPSFARNNSFLSFAEFRRDDRCPRRQRKRFVNLQRLQETYNSDAKLAPVKVKKEKKHSDKVGAMNRLTSIFVKKKNRTKTVSGLLHLIRISIMEEREDKAISYVEQLTDGTIKKKRVNDINHLFLLAVSKRMERLAMKIFERGYPPDVNAPIFVSNVSKGEAPKFGYPSYFLLVVGFGLVNLALAMVKRANVNVSWYGLTPILLASCISGQGGSMLASQLLSLGADPMVGISLEQYSMHRTLRPRPPSRFHSKCPSIVSTVYPPGYLQSALISDTASAHTTASLTEPTGLIPRGRSFHESAILSNNGYTSSAPIGQIGQSIDHSAASNNKYAEWVKGLQIYPLDIAAACENADTLSSLLRKSEQRRVRDARFCFLVQQNVDMTLELWKHGADPNQRDWGDMTCLHIAARMGLFNMVYIYLEMKMDVDLPGQNGWTALHEAISQRHREVARLLVRRGASAEAKTASGETVTSISQRVGMSASELQDYLNSVATETEQRSETEISERIEASLLSSPVNSLTGSLKNISGLPSRGVGQMGAKLAAGSRKRSESMPNSTDFPLGPNSRPRISIGSIEPVPPAATTKKKSMRKGGTLDKFAQLRQSMFSGSNSNSNSSGATKISSEPSMPASKSAEMSRSPSSSSTSTSRFRSASNRE